tara:strand:- start:48 stop:422 length:375 start_codon:yes stop_codon:yes gene_type:complete
MEQIILYIIIGAIILVLLQQLGRWLSKKEEREEKESRSRSIWEYKMSEINRNETSNAEIRELLNEFGEDNWELVSVNGRTLKLLEIDDMFKKEEVLMDIDPPYTETVEEHVYTLFFKRRIKSND